MPGLSAEEIARVDVSRQFDDVLALPDHIEDALWRVETAGLDQQQLRERLETRTAVVVCGMGGSAVGSDLAAAALGGRLTKPLLTVRGYELPSWATPDSLVVCASYSGNTEETLACYDAAGALGALRVAVTTGGRLAEAARADEVPVVPLPAGLQPRAAVGYMLVSALELVAAAGGGPGLRTEIDASCDHLKSLGSEWGPGGAPDSLAKETAGRIDGTCACVYGAGPTAAVAYRWKCQINENAKLPAFSAELPEADHNEIVGWEGAPSVARKSAIFLEDVDQHPRSRQRIELTSRLIGPHAAATLQLESRGENPLARLLSLVLLGDLVSIYLAVLREVDPAPVHVIEELKEELKGVGA